MSGTLLEHHYDLQLTRFNGILKLNCNPELGEMFTAAAPTTGTFCNLKITNNLLLNVEC